MNDLNILKERVKRCEEMIEKEKMYNPTGAYRKGRLTAMKEIRTLVKNY